MPVLGYISGSQALLLFGVGLPILFGMINLFDAWIAAIPFCGIVVLTVLRPPILGYEGRLVVIVLFHLKRRHKPKRKSDALKIPITKKLNKAKPHTSKKKPKKPSPQKTKPLVIKSSGKPVEITMTLYTRYNRASRRRVRVLLDGSDIKTALPTKSGQVSIILHPDECVGTRRISIHDVTPDDKAGNMLTEKEVIFGQ